LRGLDAGRSKLGHHAYARYPVGNVLVTKGNAARNERVT
jgi:hypothetical protein